MEAEAENRSRSRGELFLTNGSKRAKTNLLLLSGRRSMLDDKEMLAKLGKKIGDELSKLTRGVKMGFGTFVDKPVMPYVSIAGIANLEALVEPRN